MLSYLRKKLLAYFLMWMFCWWLYFLLVKFCVAKANINSFVLVFHTRFIIIRFAIWVQVYPFMFKLFEEMDWRKFVLVLTLLICVHFVFAVFFSSFFIFCAGATRYFPSLGKMIWTLFNFLFFYSCFSPVDDWISQFHYLQFCLVPLDVSI